jgi:large subunit ribosomal protein L21
VYAVVETGGKQYKVTPGQTFDVEKLAGEPGQTVELDRVLMVSKDDAVTVGQPTVSGAKVVATVVDHVKGEKLIVFKYKNKTRYHKKNGHRQNYTRLAVKDIVVG